MLLHHLFSIRSLLDFESEVIYGKDKDLEVPLLIGSSKYPFKGILSINRIPAKERPVALSTDDMIAAFVGDECRGVSHLDNSMIEYNSLVVDAYLRQQEEPVTLRYYSAAENKVYSFMHVFKPNGYLSLSINATF